MKITEIVKENQELAEGPLDDAGNWVKGKYADMAYGPGGAEEAGMTGGEKLQNRMSTAQTQQQLNAAASTYLKNWQQYAFNLPPATKADSTLYQTALQKWLASALKTKADLTTLTPLPTVAAGGPPVLKDVQRMIQDALKLDSQTRNAPAEPEQEVSAASIGKPILPELQKLARAAINSGQVTKSQMENLLQHLRTVYASLG